ncbi:MAG: hypothetical protein Q7S86_04585 [bacterium]|nr:hypothetical protein [bacterium]
MKTPHSGLATLHLNNFRVLRAGSHSGCSQTDPLDHMIDLALTVAALDSRGFVTDNEPFIREVQQMNGNDEPDRFIRRVHEFAQSRIGDRLLQVKTTARWNGLRQHEGVWKTPGFSGLPTRNAPSTLRIRSEMMPVNLVDLAVCGGYDGRRFNFDVDIGVKTSEQPASNEFRSAAERAFGNRALKASCEELASGLVSVAGRVYGDTLVAAKTRVYNLTGFAEHDWQEGWGAALFPREATGREIEESRGRSQDAAPKPC